MHLNNEKGQNRKKVMNKAQLLAKYSCDLFHKLFNILNLCSNCHYNNQNSTHSKVTLSNTSQIRTDKRKAVCLIRSILCTAILKITCWCLAMLLPWKKKTNRSDKASPRPKKSLKKLISESANTKLDIIRLLETI